MTDNGLSTAVNEALNQESFDVLEFVTGDRTPRKKVTIYTDAEAGYRLDELLALEENGVAQSDGLSITDDVPWVDEEEVAELQEKIKASALTFHLKGLAPKVRDAIQKELQARHNFSDTASDEAKVAYFEDFSGTLISRSIEKATNAAGASDTSWSTDKVNTLRGRINGTEFARLDEAVFDINTDAELFTRAVNADFLSKR